MSTMIQGRKVRDLVLGSGPVTKTTGTLAATTVPLFTIAGGLVAVTSLVGKTTTAITIAGTYKLQHNPTTGTTVDLCSATDLGTVDTAVGDVVSPAGVGGMLRGLGSISTGEALVLAIGQIEHVSTLTDGAITWYVTWYPYEDGATLVAA
jgi:hypothetical protein